MFARSSKQVWGKFKFFNKIQNHSSSPIIYDVSKLLLTKSITQSCSSIQVKDESNCRKKPSTMNSSELNNYTYELIEQVLHQDIHEKEKIQFKKKFNEILWQLYIRKDPYLLTLFEKVCDTGYNYEGSYQIMLRYYLDNNDFKKCKEVFSDIKDIAKETMSSTSYITFLQMLIKQGHYDECRWFLKEMMRHPFGMVNIRNFCFLVDSCTKDLTQSNHQKLELIIEDLSSFIIKYTTDTLNKDLLASVLQFYEQCEWKIAETYVAEKENKCNHCGYLLKEFQISNEDLIKLEQDVLNLISSGILDKTIERSWEFSHNYKKDGKTKEVIEAKRAYIDLYSEAIYENLDVSLDTSFPSSDLMRNDLESMRELKKFLEDIGHIDIVIDGMNMIYFKDCGEQYTTFRNVEFKGNGLIKVADYFAKQDKKVLVFCAGYLSEKLLSRGSFNPEIQSIISYLKDKCYLFSIDSSSVDDFYILYCLVYFKFNLKLVSSDTLGDHRFHLSRDSCRNFLRWQKTNQLYLEGFDDIGEPLFSNPRRIYLPFQKGDDVWHISATNSRLYCVNKY